MPDCTLCKKYFNPRETKEYNVVLVKGAFFGHRRCFKLWKARGFAKRPSVKEDEKQQTLGE